MFKAHFVQSSLRLAIGTVLFALVLRTWLVMGLVEPVTVAGSSMAPTLRGAHVSAECPQCNSPFDVGAEFAANARFASCPHCDQTQIPLAGFALRPSDHLWIDRTAYQRRRPRRGEVVVLRNPEDGLQLCVKRLVGLPGETVELRRGDVWINGRPWSKSLAEQRALRQLVHREGAPACRWRAEDSTCWQWHRGTWESFPDAENLSTNLRPPHPALSPEDGGEGARMISTDRWQWLRYRHEGDKPLTDDCAYNAGLSRRLNLVRDVMLAFQLRTRGAGSFAIDLADGRRTCRVSLHLSDDKCQSINLGPPHPALSPEHGGEGSWMISTDRWQWLRYRHEGDKPLTDDCAYNAGLSRRLNLLRDVMLSFQLRTRGAGSFAIDLADGRRTCRVSLHLSDDKCQSINLGPPHPALSPEHGGEVSWMGSKWKVFVDDMLVTEFRRAVQTRRRLEEDGVWVELSNFDRQLLLAIDSQVVLQYPLGDPAPPAGTSRPFAVGVNNLGVVLHDLTLYRDIYYPPQAVGLRVQPAPAVLRLGSDEYYLLGDNSPISLDSRNWGAVSDRLLVGRPLAVR